MKQLSAPLLSVQDLCVSYVHNGSRKQVLQNVSFSLREQECLTLLGESGSGKTTIAKALLALLPPSATVEAGEMRLGEGPPMNWRTPAAIRALRGSQVAMVFQDARLSLDPSLRILDHFAQTLAAHARRLPEAQLRQEATELLRQLDLAEIPRILRSYPAQLSGGMCQRVAIALALCLRPKVLIADEPTSALDVVSQLETLELLARVKRVFRLGILFITHDLAAANRISDQILVLHRGAVVEHGPAAAVLAAPKSVYAQTLLAPGRRPAEHVRSASPTKPSAPLLHVRGLKKSFVGKPRVLDGVDLTLYPGEILGLLGKSGCGKSTLSRCILGLCPYEEGTITLRGRDLQALDSKQRARRVQIIFQDARDSLNPRRTAQELVLEPLRYQKSPAADRAVLAQRYLTLVGLDQQAQGRRPPQLSTGQCQRVAIARALAAGPEVLVCDEAVSALDSGVQRQVLELIASLREKMGLSILMISHDLRVLSSFCDRIAVMEAGRLVQGGWSGNGVQAAAPYCQKLFDAAKALGLLEASHWKGMMDANDHEPFGYHWADGVGPRPEYNRNE